MKLLVQTLGDFMLNDGFGRQEVQAFRPSVVTQTPFIKANIGSKLEILSELADEADDATLAACKSEEELEAAIEALPRPAKPAAAKKPAGK